MYTSVSRANCCTSYRNCGIRGLTSSRIALPFTNDSPNLSPNPVSASAAALSVRFSLTGSICSEIEVMVSNSVLNSVVTPETSMTSAEVIRSATGSSGEVNDTYLLPKTVVAWMLACTLAGISSMYLGSTSNVSCALVVPSCSSGLTAATRPI